MRQKIFLSVLFVFLMSAVSLVRAQESMKPSYLSGEVSSLSADKIALQTKDGAIDVILSAKTEYKRVSPENPGLKAAVESAFAEIGVGDKIVVSGILATDKKSVPARTVFLMTKSDIAQRQNKEQEQWRTKGISGKVTAINPQTKEITVSTRGLMGETKTVLTPKEKSVFRRYAQDSVSYSEAKTSSIDEIKVDDFIRARGDKSADGASIQADEIISGAFQTIAGTITAVDAAKNEITISDAKTKKSVTVVVGQNSILKQFPAEMAERLAAMQSGGGMQPPNGMRPPRENMQGGQTQPNGARQGNGMRGAGGIDEMLERFPEIKVNDLKIGDVIAFSSTKSTTAERVTAIKLLSGVEPFLKAAQAASSNGRQRGGADGGFTIPGLDGGGGIP